MQGATSKAINGAPIIVQCAAPECMLGTSTVNAARAANIEVDAELVKQDVLMASLVQLVDRSNHQTFSGGGDVGIRSFVARSGTHDPSFVFIHDEIVRLALTNLVFQTSK